MKRPSPIDEEIRIPSLSDVNVGLFTFVVMYVLTQLCFLISNITNLIAKKLAILGIGSGSPLFGTGTVFVVFIPLLVFFGWRGRQLQKRRTIGLEKAQGKLCWNCGYNILASPRCKPLLPIVCCSECGCLEAHQWPGDIPPDSDTNLLYQLQMKKRKWEMGAAWLKRKLRRWNLFLIAVYLGIGCALFFWAPPGVFLAFAKVMQVCVIIFMPLPIIVTMISDNKVAKMIHQWRQKVFRGWLDAA